MARPPSPPPESWRRRIFSLTWLSYFSYYQTRKNVSFVKTNIEEAGIASRYDLAGVDTAYLALYAVGQFVWGFTSDRVSPRKLLAGGMLASAAMSILFGSTDLVLVMALAFGLNGLAQSTGWPGNGRITASWFSARERGVILGWWGTCYQVGPLVAALIAPRLFQFGWRWSLYGPALWVSVVAIAIYLLVLDTPADGGFRSPEGAGETRDPEEARRLRRQAWKSLVSQKRIWLLGGAYFCIKLTRYSLWFWLPYYFERALHYGKATSAYMSTSFDIGGIAGVIFAGYFADRMLGKRRIGAAALLLFFLAGALWIYGAFGAETKILNFTSMALVGLLLFGADSLISSAAAQDAGGPHAAGAACGFVNGLGSIGAIAQGYVTAYVSKQYGWEALFDVFLILALLGCAALIPLISVKPRDR